MSLNRYRVNKFRAYSHQITDAFVTQMRNTGLPVSECVTTNKLAPIMVCATTGNYSYGSGCWSPMPRLIYKLFIIYQRYGKLFMLKHAKRPRPICGIVTVILLENILLSYWSILCKSGSRRKSKLVSSILNTVVHHKTCEDVRAQNAWFSAMKWKCCKWGLFTAAR